MLLDFVIWNVDPEIFHLGPLHVRYYGLFFAIAFIIGYRIMNFVYKREGFSEAELDRLSIYVVISIVLGARLGHVLFYQPEYYFRHPIEILEIWKGGMASHGAALAMLIGMYIYSRKPIIPSYIWILDRISLTVPIGGAVVRFGNLMNSEIYGKHTTLPWGFVYVRDAGPIEQMIFPPQWHKHAITFLNKLPAGIEANHPTQIYEGLGYLLIFPILFYLYKNKNAGAKPGRLFGLMLIMVFTLRFLIESIKLVQVSWEKKLIADIGLNMGQLLSIPFIIIGIIMLIYSYLAVPPLKEP